MTKETLKFGKYVLLDKVATGGMADLYRAKLTGAEGFEKLIAIKKILPHLNFEEKLVTSFIDEAKLAAFLHHPNIVQIYDFGCVDDTYYIAMEYLAGKDLRYTLKKANETKTPISFEMTLYLISRLCAGLDYAHSLKDFSGNPLNIIHRDIGPQNLFITYDGQVKIIDFGIAKAETKNTNTQIGTIKGKVAYMSPEQAAGEIIDNRSDIFSIGITLYEMLTSKKMYTGDTFQALAKAREAYFEPVSLLKPDLPLAVISIVEKALAKKPENRYPSADEMCSDIENFMADNHIRLSQRDLAAYMQDLFSQENKTDESVIANYISSENVQHQDELSCENDATDISCEDNSEIFDKTINSSFLEKNNKRNYFLYGSLLIFLVVLVFYVLDRKGFYQLPVAKFIDKAIFDNRNGFSIESLENMVEEKKYAEAAVVFEDIIENRPDSQKDISGLYSKTLTGIAKSIIETNVRKAAELLEKAYKLDPSYSETTLLLGKVFTRLKKNRQAIKYYTLALVADQKNPDIFFNLGYNYAVLPDYGKAREMYMQVVELSPGFVDEALFNLAIINHKIGLEKEAIVNLNAALKVNPQNENARKFLEKLRES